MNIKIKQPARTLCALVLFAGLAVQSPAHADLLKFICLANEPKNNTFVTVYPEIEDLYESDNQLVLITAIEGSPKVKYPVNVQIQNSNGKIIYKEQKDLEIKLNQGKPYLHYIILLDNDLKSNLVPGSIYIRLNLDDKPYKDKRLQYHKQSLINKNVSKAVILPFYSHTDQFFDAKLKDEILNTFADIVRFEMQRAAPEVISSEMSGPKLSNLKIKGCLEHATCQNELTNIFAEGVFIAGDVNIPKLNYSSQGTESEASLTLFLFNSRTKESVSFKTGLLMKVTDTEREVMRALIQDIFTKKGFLYHVRSLL
jgi:hypothetical protein